MNMITTIITYPKVPKKRKSISAKREEWREDGRCMQCGGDRPCTNHRRKNA